MTADQFKQFLEENRRQVDEAAKKFEQHRVLFNKKMKRVLSIL